MATPSPPLHPLLLLLSILLSHSPLWAVNSPPPWNLKGAIFDQTHHICNKTARTGAWMHYITIVSLKIHQNYSGPYSLLWFRRIWSFLASVVIVWVSCLVVVFWRCSALAVWQPLGLTPPFWLVLVFSLALSGSVLVVAGAILGWHGQESWAKFVSPP